MASPVLKSFPCLECLHVNPEVTGPSLALVIFLLFNPKLSEKAGRLKSVLPIPSQLNVAFSQGARGTPDGTHNPKNVTHEKRLSPRAEALLTRGRATNPPPTLKIISFFFHDERRSKLSIQTYANGALCSARTFPIQN